MSIQSVQKKRRANEKTKQKGEKTLDYLCSQPVYGETTVPTAVFRWMLLAKDGWVMASGTAYDIKGKSLGAGVYRVWLEQKEKDHDR